MNKYAIVVDSSIALSLKDQENYKDLYVAPLSLIYNGKEYIDQHEITIEEIQDILRKNELIQTSQPNVGACIELYEKVLAKGYTHIFVLALSSNLSGTFNSFRTAADNVDADKITVIDSYTIAGAIQGAFKLVKEDSSVEEIKASLLDYFEDTVSYVIPETLDQLKASGRISPAAATLASLLKMRVLLKLENHGPTIEKFATARTEKKLLDALVNDFVAFGFNTDKYMVYLLESEGMDLVDKVTKALEEKFGPIQTELRALPAAVSGHAGNGTVAVQIVRKVV